MATDLREQLQATLGTAYTLEHELGGGGMSRVFVATETALGRRVVVKVLPPELAQGVSVERFKREIQLAAQLQHPHIVPVLAAGEIGGLPYYTMPLVEGHSLRARLTKGGPLPITEAIGVLRDVAKALAYAHERGVVHRDIKPDNVLETGGSAVVTDFGVAKALSVAKTLTPGGTLTQVGSSLGTPAYMAPEQAAADPSTDHRADLYAFGVMAYELLAGQPPFHGRTPHKLLAAHMSERPEPIADLRPDTPPLLAELVMRCLAKEPDTRPQSAADVVRVLETVTSGSAHPAMPAILLGGRRRLGRALAIYAGAFVCVAIVARAAIVGIGLPDWVFPGALIVMALGFPVILFTAFVHVGAHRAMTMAQLTPGGTPVAQSTMTRFAVKASPWVSWRRTAIGGVLALGTFGVLVGGFMLLRALGVGPPGSLLAAGKLGEKERLLVTDFRTGGADTALGGVLTEAVRTGLAQSSAVSVLPPSVVAAALDRMQRPETTHVDLALARDIAAREGIKGIVDGSITPLGSGGYIVTERLVAADAGDELASFHATIDGAKELIPAIDQLTRDLRAKIGESLRMVRSSPPLEQVTTPSLAALRKYVTGVRANDNEGDYPKAIASLRDAVAIDTAFAMAYRKLGIALGNAGAPQTEVDSALAKAYGLRDHLTERERLLAIAAFFDQGPGADRARAASAYETVLARDSLDDVAMNNLGGILMGRREFARGESLFRRAIASRRAGTFEYGLTVITRIDQGRLAAADMAVRAAQAAFPASAPIRPLDIWPLYAEGRVDSMGKRLAMIRSTDDDAFNRSEAMHLLSNLALLRGQLRESARSDADARAQDSAREATPPPLADVLHAALIDIWFREDRARGTQELDAALARTPLRGFPERLRPDFAVATLYARAGRPDRARAVLATLANEVRDTSVIRSHEPDRHNTLAEIAIAERRPLDAVTEFRMGDRLPDGPADDCAPCLFARLGRAFDMADMPDSAVAMYEAYLKTPYARKANLPQDPSLLAGIHKRLGELYEAKGEREQAAVHYAKFIELWRSADPELQPKVADARRRLASVTQAERR